MLTMKALGHDDPINTMKYLEVELDEVSAAIREG